MNARYPRRRAFSLIELVVVVVILGVIAAIAIPRMSRGAAGASDSGVASDLAVLRSAIEVYRAEHGGDYPPVGTFADAMTQYSDKAGNTQATPDSSHIYGPYLTAIPALKVGANRGATGVAGSDGAGVGWIYDASTGSISANATESDASGVPYADY